MAIWVGPFGPMFEVCSSESVPFSFTSSTILESRRDLPSVKQRLRRSRIRLGGYSLAFWGIAAQDVPMSFDEFVCSIRDGVPPDRIQPALLALWHGKAGNWGAAHRVVQDVPTVNCSWAHAWLHRLEGDDDNAAYWYRKANRQVPSVSKDEEWEAIVTTLLAEQFS